MVMDLAAQGRVVDCRTTMRPKEALLELTAAVAAPDLVSYPLAELE
jgi:hypothetical protein